VREWILQNTRILASIDLHSDTFQPFVSIQTSILILERKTDELIKLERAKGRINDYAVFMAVANHIGHDKRGHTTYVRDAQGHEIEEQVPDLEPDWEAGKPVFRSHTTTRKVVDDNTLQIAAEFRRWLSEQE
jgi:type I restriction enzyme M protein